MPRELKVYHGCFDGMSAWVVAAPTKKAAAALFGVGPHEMCRVLEEIGACP